jgi:hypothetical protein
VLLRLRLVTARDASVLQCQHLRTIEPVFMIRLPKWSHTAISLNILDTTNRTFICSEKLTCQLEIQISKKKDVDTELCVRVYVYIVQSCTTRTTRF